VENTSVIVQCNRPVILVMLQVTNALCMISLLSETVKRCWSSYWCNSLSQLCCVEWRMVVWFFCMTTFLVLGLSIDADWTGAAGNVPC